MNKFELETLVAIRIKDAEVLLNAGCYPGAYYLAGYAVECALKACIAHKVNQYDFPDKDLATKSYIHDLSKLLIVSGLAQDLAKKEKEDDTFKANWLVANSWSEASRYNCSIKEKKAKELFDAITNTKSGILTWLKNYF